MAQIGEKRRDTKARPGKGKAAPLAPIKAPSPSKAEERRAATRAFLVDRAYVGAEGVGTKRGVEVESIRPEIQVLEDYIQRLLVELLPSEWVRPRIVVTIEEVTKSVCGARRGNDMMPRKVRDDEGRTVTVDGKAATEMVNDGWNHRDGSTMISIAIDARRLWDTPETLQLYLWHQAIDIQCAIDEANGGASWNTGPRHNKVWLTKANLAGGISIAIDEDGRLKPEYRKVGFSPIVPSTGLKEWFLENPIDTSAFDKVKATPPAQAAPSRAPVVSYQCDDCGLTVRNSRPKVRLYCGGYQGQEHAAALMAPKGGEETDNS